jgi:hypothetical protein
VFFSYLEFITKPISQRLKLIDERRPPLFLSSQPLDDLPDIGLKALNPFWRPSPARPAC